MQIEFLDMHPLKELVVLVMIVETEEQLKTIIYQKGHEFKRASNYICISVYSILNDQIMLCAITADVTLSFFSWIKSGMNGRL